VLDEGVGAPMRADFDEFEFEFEFEFDIDVYIIAPMQIQIKSRLYLNWPEFCFVVSMSTKNSDLHQCCS
jgi:hypothetical protein